MSLAILLQTLRDKARGTGLAMLLILIFVVYMAAMFPEVQKMTGLDEIMKSPGFEALLGKVPDFTSFDGFITLELFTLSALVICGYIAFLAASFLAGEIEMKTIDLLLAQPVTRVRLVIDRYAALIPVVILLVATIMVGLYVGTQYMGIAASYGWLAYALIFAGAFMLAYGGIALLISALLSDGRTAAIVSLGLLFVMYFMETIGESVDKVSAIRSLSLFHYVQYSNILVYHDLNLGNMGVLIAVAVISVALAIYTFHRRDINVV